MEYISLVMAESKDITKLKYKMVLVLECLPVLLLVTTLKLARKQL